MAASPQLVQSNPVLLTGRQDVYSAPDFRKPYGDIIGAGVTDYESFRVRQRSAGANMSVDCMSANVGNRGYLRASQTLDLGLYRVDFLNAVPVNVDIAAADATFPRIDQLFLTVEDSQIVGGNDRATVRVVPGVPTVGATLDNKTGAGAVPANMASLLLADIIVPAASSSVPNANIRDRRAHALPGTIPGLANNALVGDIVALTPAPGLVVQNIGITPGSHDTMQAAALMWCPRRIVGATRIRWAYIQNATPNTGNWNMAICDASGRKTLAETGAIAFGGAANARNPVSAVIPATTFDIGWYYVFFGVGAITGASACTFVGISDTVTGGQPAIALPGTLYRGGVAGTVLPATILGLLDGWSLVAAQFNLPVPIVALSVG